MRLTLLSCRAVFAALALLAIAPQVCPAAEKAAKIGDKVEAGSVLCRLYYTKEDHVEEAAEMVEDAFRISSQKPDERELILEVVG